MKTSITLFQFISLFITSIAQTRIYQPGNITIGVLLPLHLQDSINTCGKFHSVGLGYIEAISYTVAQINKNASILRNCKLGIDVRDYCDSPVLAVRGAYSIATNNAFENLLEGLPSDYKLKIRNELVSKGIEITSPVAAVIGTEDSGSSSLLSSLLQVVNITMISPFATSEELSSPYHSTFFRTIPPDGHQAKAMVDVIERYGWQYIAIVAIDHSYGRYGVRALERESFDRKTFCIAIKEYFTSSGYKGQVKAIVEKLKRASNIKVIILWITYQPVKKFLEEATSQRMIGRTFLISESVTILGKEALEKYSEILAGSLGIVPHHYRAERFVRHLKSLTPTHHQHKLTLWRKFWETEFGCTTTALNNGLKICDSNLTVGHKYDKLYNSFIPYVMDATYALAHALDSMINRKEKNSHQVGNCLESLKPGKLAEFMKNVSFRGITGQVLFNDKGNPIGSYYDVVNFQLNHKHKLDIITVGFWEGKNTELTINESLIQWNTEHSVIPESTCSKACPPGFKQTNAVSCCWECIECPEGSISAVRGSRNCSKCHQEQKSNRARTKCVNLPYKHVQWDDIMAIICAALGVLGIVGTLFTIGVFIIFKHTPIVKASNRELGFVLLVLILMCFVLAFLHLTHPTNLLCLVMQPWRYITCTYCVSILYLKTNRLVRAFQTTIIPSWFKKYVLDRRRQHLVVFLLNIIQIILTTIWLVLDPPYLYKDIKPQKHIFLTCRPCKTSVGYGIRASMFAYLVFLSGLCTLYAFKARRLPENFNEAKFIAFAMYILLVSWVVYYPVDSTLEGAYNTFVACVTALSSAYGLLGCVFVPKVYVMVFYSDKNTVVSVKAEVGQFSKKMSESVELERAKRASSFEVTA